MDWDAIGAIGEVVGAAGVIFSLIYLGTLPVDGISAEPAMSASQSGHVVSVQQSVHFRPLAAAYNNRLPMLTRSSIW